MHGWGWEDVLPYYKRMENNELRGSDVHGVGGPVNVADQVEPRPLTERFLKAAQRTGIPRNPDINSPEQDGVAQTPVSQNNGRRWSAADAYLRPAMKRPNLTVAPRSQALEIDLDGGRATGVRWRDSRGRERVARANREVVLSAGAIGSPQLLMLSGIGPGEQLRELGIEPGSRSPASARTSRTTPSSCSASSRRSTRTSPTPRSRRRCSSGCSGGAAR